MLKANVEELDEIREKKYNINTLFGIGILKTMLHKELITQDEYIKIKRDFIKKMNNI